MGGAAIAPPSSLVDRDGKSFDPSGAVGFKHQQNRYGVTAAEKEQALLASVLNPSLISGTCSVLSKLFFILPSGSLSETRDKLPASVSDVNSLFN